MGVGATGISAPFFGIMLLFLGVSMKIDRHGQAKILTQSEIQLLFSQGLQNNRDSEALLRSADRALFGICLYCCCRINEACTLSVNDVYHDLPSNLPQSGNTANQHRLDQ